MTAIGKIILVIGKLPSYLCLLVRKQYNLWKLNPRNPLVDFKKIGPRCWIAR